MKVNIYYGGRGVVDDPTIFVVNKIQEVLDELNVNVERYNLYEMKNQITTLSQTVTEADAVVLATTVEWIGMGGYMQTLLDACWLYADKGRIGDVYMFPVVMSKTYGEREVCLSLVNSWEMIGGRTGNGITGYVDDTTEFEFNSKCVEYLYTLINLIESLAAIYKELLSDEEHGGDDYYINVFKNSFRPGTAFSCTYMIIVSDKNKTILINVNNDILDVEFGENNNADVIAKLNKAVFDDIVAGKITFHRAFMTGEMTAKGNFRSLRMLDSLFEFAE